MTAAGSLSRIGGFSARTWGALAVVGVVIAFSLSSTLVKRAESPGVLVAFWRLTLVSVVWNLLLWSTGRRVTLRDVRQALVPGVFFGLNLAMFFAGATQNSVANAALIGSLSPLLTVPIGAVLFAEYFDPRALAFAVVAFGGTVIVLFSAPPAADASLRGNVFGVLAMLLWTGYVVTTRRFRRDMDVATFMATVSPIAALAVFPLAIPLRDHARDRLRPHVHRLIPVRAAPTQQSGHEGTTTGRPSGFIRGPTDGPVRATPVIVRVPDRIALRPGHRRKALQSRAVQRHCGLHDRIAAPVAVRSDSGCGTSRTSHRCVCREQQ